MCNTSELQSIYSQYFLLEVVDICLHCKCKLAFISSVTKCCYFHLLNVS